MTRTKLLLLFTLFAGAALPAFADQIPYPHPGTIAPQTLIFATSNSVNAYYVGSTAGYEDQLGIYDVQTGWNSGKILDNKTTTPGTKVTIGGGAGQINIGDELLLFIASPDGLFANVANYSADGINHAYLTTYSGGTVNGAVIPAGFFAGMEDLKYANSDLNYNDEDIVLTGVSTSVTPEPAALALFATGMLGLIGLKQLRGQDEV